MSDQTELTSRLFKDKDITSVEGDKVIPKEFALIMKAFRDNPIKELDGISKGLINYYTGRTFTRDQILGHDIRTLVLEPTDEQRRATHAYSDGDYDSFVEYMHSFQNTGNTRFLIDSSKDGNEIYVVIDNDTKSGILTRREFHNGMLSELYVNSIKDREEELPFDVEFSVSLNSNDENKYPIRSRLLLSVPDYRSKYSEERTYSGNELGTKITFSTQLEKVEIGNEDPSFDIENSNTSKLESGLLLVFGGKRKYEEYKNQNKDK